MNEVEATSLGVLRPGEPYLFRTPVRSVEEGAFRVRTLWSGFSAGTELALVRGTYPHLTWNWDTTVDAFTGPLSVARYPVREMGYMEVAEVVESRNATVPLGQRLAMCYGHRTDYVAIPADHHFPLPPGMSPRLGVLLAQMAPIGINALLHAAAEKQRPVEDPAAGVRDGRVLVIGAGVVGILTALIAADLGAAEVVVADSRARHRAVAEALGLESVNCAATSLWQWCKQRWRSGPAAAGADVVFQCRARGEALSEAFTATRRGGVVVDVAFYQDDVRLRLGHEFHLNGLVHRCAQVDNPPDEAWDRPRLAREATVLVERHAAGLETHLLTDEVALADAPAFVADMARRRRDTLQVVFDMQRL